MASSTLQYPFPKCYRGLRLPILVPAKVISCLGRCKCWVKFWIVLVRLAAFAFANLWEFVLKVFLLLISCNLKPNKSLTLAPVFNLLKRKNTNASTKSR